MTCADGCGGPVPARSVTGLCLSCLHLRHRLGGCLDHPTNRRGCAECDQMVRDHRNGYGRPRFSPPDRTPAESAAAAVVVGVARSVDEYTLARLCEQRLRHEFGPAIDVRPSLRTDGRAA